MEKNKYKVGKKAWESWSEKAREVFNRSYPWLSANQEFTKHPQAKVVEQTLWDTVAWNASWVAANACDSIETKIEA